MTDILTGPTIAAQAAVATALERARARVARLQSAGGWWKGELATNVTMEAEDILLRHFLGILTPEVAAATGRWIRSQQRVDGTWATFPGGPADLSTTFEAWVALRVVGDAADAPHMTEAAAYVRSQGGLAATRVFTRIWLALFGEVNWDDLPSLPPEIVLLPRWVPLNVYDFACWARQTIVPLTVVRSLRPARPLGVDLAPVRTGRTTRRPRPPSWRAWVLTGLDAVARRYERHPIQPLRRFAVRRAERWILERQEADGSWGGIQPPWVYSLLALHLLGRDLDDPVLARGLAGLDRFTVLAETPEGMIRRLEACQSPVWDTALAVIALADAGTPPADDRLRRAADWLRAEEVRVAGDWAVQRPDLAPGGWAFEFDNDFYPDVDDTAEVVLALLRTAGGSDPAATRAAVERAVTWVLGMQCRDGGWAAFDVDNTRALVRDLPFCDFGEVIDPPSADVTAHVVEMLAAVGRANDPATRRGVAWLLAAQEPGGSWFGRWGANHVYGTGAVLPALVAAGLAPDAPPVRRAVEWLGQVQNADGGWGEDLRSYRDPAWVGRGDSTPSQTGWALLGLLAAGERGDVVRRGVDYLVRTQRADGGWDEPVHTGTGFPGDFYISYFLYREVFPLSALGRYCQAVAP